MKTLIRLPQIKGLPLVVLALLFGTLTYGQNVPNRGFENWESEKLFESPKDWQNTNTEGRGRVNVIKSTDARSGSYSIRMVNKPDSSFGYFLMGTVGEQGPDGGVPYSSPFDSVTGWYKCDMKPGDTAMILLFKFTSTDTVRQFFKLFGTQNQWMRFSFAVDTLSQSSVFFGMVSTDPFEMNGINPNSWLQVDDVAFTYSGTGTPDPLPNPSFEVWESVEVFEPESWNSMNQLSVLTGDSLSVLRSTDAHSGQYAMKVRTASVPGSRKVGWAYTGNHPNGPQGFTGGFAYDGVPTSLSGFYKYVPNGSDTGMILITGTEYHNTGDSIIRAFITGIPVTASNNYVPFSIPIQYDTSRVHIDTINIIMVSSRLIFDFPERAPDGSYLLVDDLWIESRCAYTDTMEVFAKTDTTIQYAPPAQPTIQTDSPWQSYQWSTGDTTRSITLADDTNRLSIVVYDTNSCRIRDNIVVILQDTTTGLEAINPQFQARVYPNPSQGQLSIEIDYINCGKVVISNQYGQMVGEQMINSGRTTLDITSLSSGIYFIEVYAEETRILRKKMVKRP